MRSSLGSAEPEHPWVRRNLVEALYIIGDENIRYLYNNWLPSLADDVSRGRATAAQHATVNRLADKYVTALKGDNALRREGILRAMSEFHERPDAGRAGSATTSSRSSSTTRPAEALGRAARHPRFARPDDPPPGAPGDGHAPRRSRPALARAVALRRGDPDADVREWAATMSKEFPLDVKPGKADAAIDRARRRPPRQPAA